METEQWSTCSISTTTQPQEIWHICREYSFHLQTICWPPKVHKLKIFKHHFIIQTYYFYDASLMSTSHLLTDNPVVATNPHRRAAADRSANDWHRRHSHTRHRGYHYVRPLQRQTLHSVSDPWETTLQPYECHSYNLQSECWFSCLCATCGLRHFFSKLPRPSIHVFTTTWTKTSLTAKYSSNKNKVVCWYQYDSY